MATEFTTEFDGTNGAAANLTTEPAFFGRTASNGWFYRTGDKASGTASINTTNDVTLTSVWTYAHSAGLIATRYYDQCYKVTTLPGSEIIIAQIRSGGTNRAQVTLDQNGVVRIKNGTTTVDSTAAGFITANQWFRWKWGITGGTQELRLYTNATPANLFGTAPSDTLIGNMTQGTWDQYRLGIMSGVALEVWVDRLVIDDSTWPTSGGAGNAAPVANAGPDQDSVIGGSTVTLNGTGSTDADGTITAYAWSQKAGTVVTLSSTTVASPTFTAPTKAGTATFELRVTDDAGTQSVSDSVVITWSDEPATTPTSDFYDRLQGASPPTALTQSPGNTDFDTVDAGWTFVAPVVGTGIGSAQASGSGAVRILTHNLASLVSSQYMDAIFVISDLTAGPWYIMRIMDGTTLRGTVRVNTNGSIQCRNNVTAVGTETTGKVTAGEAFRVAWHANNGGTQTARLYTGANLFGTTPDNGFTTSGALNAGTFNRCGFGIAAPATLSGTLKILIPQVEASTWPDPFGSSVAATASGLYRIDAGPTYSPVAFDIL